MGTEEAAGLCSPHTLGLGRTPFLDQSKCWKPDPSLCPLISPACGIQFLLLNGRKKEPCSAQPGLLFHTVRFLYATKGSCGLTEGVQQLLLKTLHRRAEVLFALPGPFSSRDWSLLSLV